MTTIHTILAKAYKTFRFNEYRAPEAGRRPRDSRCFRSSMPHVNRTSLLLVYLVVEFLTGMLKYQHQVSVFLMSSEWAQGVQRSLCMSVTRRKTAEGIALLVSALLFTSGCYNTYQVRPSELVKLDGFPSGLPPENQTNAGGPTRPPMPRSPIAKPRYSLTDQHGERIDFTKDDKLTLKTRSGELGGRFAQIRVDPTRDSFRGTTMDGKEIGVPLSLIELAKIERLSGGKSLLATIAIIVLVGGAIAGLFVAALYSVPFTAGL